MWLNRATDYVPVALVKLRYPGLPRFKTVILKIRL